MKTSLPNPPEGLLWNLLNYVSSTGSLTWRKSGKEAGCVSKNGHTAYRRVKINGKLYMAHRLVWTMYYHADPKLDEVDHKDGNGLNNRITNLRRVPPSFNRRNLVRKRRLQQAGVYWNEKLNKFEVNGKDNGRQIYLGLFESEREAVTHRLLFDRRIAIKTGDELLLKKCDYELSNLVQLQSGAKLGE